MPLDIDFIDDGIAPRIDPFDRTLKRRFVILPGQPERFDQSGRLYGGFWQNLKSERRRHIRVRGEPVAVLDYGSMFTRLAYESRGNAARWRPLRHPWAGRRIAAGSSSP